MCGICGVVSAEPQSPIPEAALLHMRDSLAHRGPDDSGHYLAPGVALGVRRLAILDLSQRGHMPMSTPDGRYWIVHNGEVYNYRQIRPDLEARGFLFRSNTDTEVLLYLYASEGPEMLERLNGMFAFAIWDSLERSLFIARDRLGIKPLYYAQLEGRLYFASEEKALFDAGVPARFDHGKWEELLCFRYVAGEATPFEGVSRLLPGHYMVWREGQTVTHRWWNLSERARARMEELPKDPVSWYREVFDDAVRLRRISDVPLGVLLSGGLDSSCVAASLANDAGEGVSSFTVTFSEPEYDEGPVARCVAAQWRLDGQMLTVSADEMLSGLRQATWFHDEPLAHGNDLHLLAISRYAKPRVTVLLSGEGADETLGGYLRYQPLRMPALLSLARPWLPRVSAFTGDGRWRKLARFLELGSTRQFVLLNACDILPQDLGAVGLSPTGLLPYRERVLSEAESLYPNQPVRQAMYSDQHTFLCSVLDRNDRMTMGASMECRVPFLDYRLVETAAALPSNVLFRGRHVKRLLRDSMGHRLPAEVLRHRKWGFGVPWKTYMRQAVELRSVLADLPGSPLLLESPLDPSLIRQRVNEFLIGDDGPFPLVMGVLMAVLSWEAIQGRQRLDVGLG